MMTHSLLFPKGSHSPLESPTRFFHPLQSTSGMKKAGIPEDPAAHLIRGNITNLTPVRDATVFLSTFISRETLHCHYAIVNYFFKRVMPKKNPLELIKEFSKVTGYKISIQKSVVFLNCQKRKLVRLLRNTVGRIPEEFKNRTTRLPSNATSGSITEGNGKTILKR